VKLDALSFAVPVGLRDALARAYATPPRAYHGFGHVEETLEHFRSVPAWDDPASVALALLFHDAVYVAGRGDNEQNSAAFAEASLRAFPPAITFDVERVKTLIGLTARHGSISGHEVDSDAAQFLDCDMAILGSAPGRFDEYEQQIGIEYSHLPSDTFRAGRAAFLQRLLARPRIYLTEWFVARYEAAARRNLERSVRRLGAGWSAG
jgi:predicted metal-dependent HD superfamily phosphohydrolase